MPTNTVTAADGTVTTTVTDAQGKILSVTAAYPITPETANQTTLQQQAAGALANNRTYLAIGTPTNAQVTAQVRALTQQNIGIIRLALSQFDGTN